MRIAIVSNYNMVFIKDYITEHEIHLVDLKNISSHIKEINPSIVVTYIRDIFLTEDKEYIDYLISETCNLDIPTLNYNEYMFCIDAKMYYLTRFPFGLPTAGTLADFILEDIKNIENPKKVIIVDADNTLWGGEIAEGDIQLSEDGVGKIHRDFQKILLKCVDKGAIICIASKNYHDNVVKGLDHPMSLLKNKIVIIKSNFDDKSKNIQEIARELNLGLDSFIFIDDSIREIDDVNSTLPMVTTFTVPKEIEKLVFDFQVAIYNPFFKYRVASDRTSIYKKEMIRKNYNDLDIKLTIHKNEPSHTNRVNEMAMKTNQFNSRKEWKANEKNSIYTLEYEDKFGKEGVIGYIIADELDEDILIVSMAMSCRVLARGVEEEFLNAVLQNYKILFFSYHITDKNKLVLDFCDKYGIMVNMWSNHSIKTKGLQIDKRYI